LEKKEHWQKAAHEMLMTLTTERADILRYNFLAQEVEKARNNSDFLGYGFINTCPELNNFQSEYVLYGFGSNKCTYQVPIL